MASPPEYSAQPNTLDASRPSLGFPLGTAMLLIIIFILSGVISCCYHWDKLRSLRGALDSDADPEANDQEYPTKAVPACTDMKAAQSESVPVIMPGDEIPKFVALPCPCQPIRPEMIVMKVEEPPMVVTPL